MQIFIKALTTSGSVILDAHPCTSSIKTVLGNYIDMIACVSILIQIANCVVRYDVKGFYPCL